MITVVKLGLMGAAVALLAIPRLTAQASMTRLGIHRVAVVLLNWEDDQRQAVSPAEARTAFAGMASWFERSSYGAFTLVPDVYGWVTAPVLAGGQCVSAQAPLHGGALVSAQIGPALWNAYRYRVFVLPNTGRTCTANSSVCAYPSNSVVYDAGLGTAIHELGHAILCLNHTNDPFDRMNGGGFSGVFGPQAKTQLGWLNTPGQPTTRHITASGRYTIEGYEEPGRGVKALDVEVPTSVGLLRKVNYWVDVRGGGTVTVHSGFTIVDLDPGEPVDYDLNSGQAWTSPEGLTLRTVGTSTASAVIDVTMVPSRLANAPH